MSEEPIVYTAEELAMIEETAKSYGNPIPDDKFNIFTLIKKVSIAKDTTKLGNLDKEELGSAFWTERGCKEMALISQSICNKQIWADYFDAEGEILTATSLSKEGFLLKLGIIQQRSIDNTTKRNVNKKSLLNLGRKKEE